MHSIIIRFLTKASSRNMIGRKFGSNWGSYYLLFENKTVQRFVHCHVLSRSPPGWHLNDKYQHVADFPICVQMFHSYYGLVETVIHIQSARSHICVYTHTHTHTHILHNIETLTGKKNNKLGDQ